MGYTVARHHRGRARSWYLSRVDSRHAFIPCGCFFVSANAQHSLKIGSALVRLGHVAR
jgi:hypothetical protein